MGGYIVDKNAVAKGIEHAFSLFPVLKERSKQMAGTLSGGEQQMLAIARALMSNPKILMLDEPSLGLAPILIQDVFALIKKIHKQGTTVLLVEQNARMALSISDRGYVLETGKITMTDTGRNLIKSDKVIEAYLGGA
jgi:branched-chain amino acid transport system ATP-binding protein